MEHTIMFNEYVNCNFVKLSKIYFNLIFQIYDHFDGGSVNKVVDLNGVLAFRICLKIVLIVLRISSENIEVTFSAVI